MKSALPFIALFFFSALRAQQDTAKLKNLYAHALDFTEARVDSIGYYAAYISAESGRLNFPTGALYSLRLYGFYYENKADYKRAIDYYLQTLYEARKQNDIEMQTGALTDLAVIYTENIKQPVKAKEIYLECVALNKKKGDARSLIDSYTNLGAIYDRLGLYDSALLFLHEGLRIGKPLEANSGEDLSTLYNNLGNTFFLKKKYDEALFYFRNNFEFHQGSGNFADKWFDELNLADVYTEQGAYDSAGKYALLSMALAHTLESRSKEADSYAILSKLYQHKGDYKRAFDYQRRWYELDTSLVNGETYKAIAELEQRFEARQRENEKLLLQAEVSQQRLRYRITLILAISLLIVAIVAAMAFVMKRNNNRTLQRTNELIVRQNERLSELNYEKNSLISIVSHDLSTPFASIGMWSQLLRSDPESLTAEQQKALARIDQATGYGEKLIRNILDVEKAQTNQHKVMLENLDLKAIVSGIFDEFHSAAARKNISLHLDAPAPGYHILSDRQLLGRMLENLLSNALKFSPSGKKVRVSIREEKEALVIRIRDEGIGIDSDELPHLFSKYSRISSRPTQGEPSTGLGLSIVKRIVEELNGQITCESEPGEGTLFTITLKK